MRQTNLREIVLSNTLNFDRINLIIIQIFKNLGNTDTAIMGMLFV